MGPVSKPSEVEHFSYLVTWQAKTWSLEFTEQSAKHASELLVQWHHIRATGSVKDLVLKCKMIEEENQCQPLVSYAGVHMHTHRKLSVTTLHEHWV